MDGVVWLCFVGSLNHLTRVFAFAQATVAEPKHPHFTPYEKLAILYRLAQN